MAAVVEAVLHLSEENMLRTPSHRSPAVVGGDEKGTHYLGI
jgi:hypothetical protein